MKATTLTGCPRRHIIINNQDEKTGWFLHKSERVHVGRDGVLKNSSVLS
jgi:hypothetical protein